MAINLRKFWKKITSSTQLNKNNNKSNFLKIIDEKLFKKKILISVNDLEMSYKTLLNKNKLIFSNVSFDIYENKILALVGSNGCGKTTIVEIISQLKKQTNGEIIYNYPINKNNLDIGVQFQDLSFPRGLTVKDLINFQIKLLDNMLDFHELEEILKIFRLNDLLNLKISKLSGGQQQRLNVLLAIICKPRILFLDEFTTGLDISIKNEIKNFILNYVKKHNISIVLISHDIEIISDMADYFVVLGNKTLLVNTTKEKIINKFRTVSEFLYKYIK